MINGRVYGYVHPTLVPRRIVGNNNERLRDVAIALFAKNPETGGQYLVGWHRHARVNEPVEYRDRPAGNDGGVFLWSCASVDATLLPKIQRTLLIPKGKGGTGQAQVTYARESDGPLRKAAWMNTVRRFILNYEGQSLTGADSKTASASVLEQDVEESMRGQGIVANALLRRAIEAHAMRRVKAILKKRFGSAHADVSASESFDFLCSAKGKTVKVEVKGTRSTGESLLFSAAEVALARTEPVDLYVVSGIRVNGNPTDGYKASGGDVEHVPNWGRSKFDAAPLAFQITRRL